MDGWMSFCFFHLMQRDAKSNHVTEPSNKSKLQDCSDSSLDRVHCPAEGQCCSHGGVVLGLQQCLDGTQGVSAKHCIIKR